MQSVQLIRSPLWERRDIDVEKLGQLVWSMLEGGWTVGHPIHFRRVDDTNEIVWGHRRTLSWVLANSMSADTLEELITKLRAMAVTTTMGLVCPMCGVEIDREMDTCPECGTSLFSDAEFLGVEGEISVPNSHYFIDSYNEIVHGVDVTIPAEEVVLTDDLSLQLSMLGDNMGRDDVDILGMILSVERAVKLGATSKQIGALGIGQSEMQYYVAAAGVPYNLLELIRDGAIALSVPFHITSLPVGPQRQAVYDIIIDRGTATVASVKEMVRKIKASILPSVSMEDSPRTANLKRITCAYIERINQVELWKLVAIHGEITPSCVMGAVTLDMMESLGLTCAMCPLNGKMIAIKNISNGAYPCQTDPSYTNGCLMHSEQVYADFTVADKATVKYADNSLWFESFDLALGAYGAIVESAVPIAEDARPIDGQREIIRMFMDGHVGANGAEHPYATICSQCKYHLTTSPTRDVTVPLCEWAARRSRVSMGYLVDEKAYRIPRCYQYAPIASPLSIVPDTDPGALYDLDGLISQLHARLQVHSEPALTILTGVPLGASVPFADWFDNMMKELHFTWNQKATIAMWLLFELRLSSGKASLALREGRVGTFKFIPITP